MTTPKTQQLLARVGLAVPIALAITWPVFLGADSIVTAMLVAVAYWTLFALLFSIGATSGAKLTLSLVATIVMAFLAPFGASIALSKGGTESSFGWVGLTALFIVAAAVTGVYRSREIPHQ